MGEKPLVACFSKLLDTVTEESRMLTFDGAIIVSTPHQVRIILNQKVGRWLTDSWILKYEAIILVKDDSVLTTAV